MCADVRVRMLTNWICCWFRNEFMFTLVILTASNEMLLLLLIWKLEDVSFGKLCFFQNWRIQFAPEIIFSMKSMLFISFLTVFY